MNPKRFLQARLLRTSQPHSSYSDAGNQTNDHDHGHGHNTLNPTRNNTHEMSSSFLPELTSTPPLPTLQKPTPHLSSEVLPPISNPGRLLTRPHRVTVVGQAPPRDRPDDSPPLPRGWTQQHDRAICMLDARMYSLPAIVAKLRRACPDLRGVLTPGMVDIRLRQLDQNVEIDYWKVELSRLAVVTNARAGVGSRPPSPMALATARIDSDMSVKGNMSDRQSMVKPQLSPPKSTSAYEIPTEPAAVRPGQAF